MTAIYFIRHAQADNSVRNGMIRPLTEKGLKDRPLITSYLADKRIDKIFSSPYKRAIDTISDFADKAGLEIVTVEDFRERRSDSDWLRDTDFWPLIERQWNDFDYSLSDGESLGVVQRRNIAALNGLLADCAGQNVVIGTHGTALSTIINFYDSTYGFSDFAAMVDITPWVVRMCFCGIDCQSIEKIDVFKL